jgi:hypothetical protein
VTVTVNYSEPAETAISECGMEGQVALSYSCTYSACSILTFLQMSLDYNDNLSIRLSITGIFCFPVQQILVFRWFGHNGFAGVEKQLLC